MRLQLLLMSALLGAGCTTVASPLLVPQALAVEGDIGGSVSITAAGSAKRAYIMRPLVPAEAIEEALTAAVQAAGLFDEVVPAGGDRQLKVTIERLDEPEIGIDQTCTVTLAWRLSTGDRARTLWEQRITTTRTVNSLDELDSEARGQLAIEGAIRRNLRQGIERLSRESYE